MTPLEALEKAVTLAGGQTALAGLIGAKQQTVNYWLTKMGKCAPEYARPIEAAVEGKVTRYQLRPDVFGVEPASAVEGAA